MPLRMAEFARLKEGAAALDLEARKCTVHPFTADGIELPPGIELGRLARSVQDATVRELGRTGWSVVPAGADKDDEAVAVTGRFTMVVAGSRLKRFFAPPMSGAAAIVEVEGLVSERGIPLDEFGAQGMRSLGPLGGSARSMVNGAAAIAGREAARRAIAILVGE